MPATGRRIKAAKFPATKCLDSFDFAAIPRLNKMLVPALARGEWIERRENVIALGPSGTGRTHVALGLGLAACQKALSVGFRTAAALVNELISQRLLWTCALCTIRSALDTSTPSGGSVTKRQSIAASVRRRRRCAS
jgi:hypothetical protein